MFNKYFETYGLHIEHNVYNKDICEWIISESEKNASTGNGWTTKRHENYPTTDLPIEYVNNVFSFINLSFKNTICPIIRNFYNISENCKIKIREGFIVKYEFSNGGQTSLDMHTDVSTVTITILLSDENSFNGGGLRLENGSIYYSKKGSLIVFPGSMKHSALPITNGIRYVLVFFVDIDLVN